MTRIQNVIAALASQSHASRGYDHGKDIPLKQFLDSGVNGQRGQLAAHHQVHFRVNTGCKACVPGCDFN